MHLAYSFYVVPKTHIPCQLAALKTQLVARALCQRRFPRHFEPKGTVRRLSLPGMESEEKSAGEVKNSLMRKEGRFPESTWTIQTLYTNWRQRFKAERCRPAACQAVRTGCVFPPCPFRGPSLPLPQRLRPFPGEPRSLRLRRPRRYLPDEPELLRN